MPHIHTVTTLAQAIKSRWGKLLITGLVILVLLLMSAAGQYLLGSVYTAVFDDNTIYPKYKLQMLQLKNEVGIPESAVIVKTKQSKLWIPECKYFSETDLVRTNKTKAEIKSFYQSKLSNWKILGENIEANYLDLLSNNGKYGEQKSVVLDFDLNGPSTGDEENWKRFSKEWMTTEKGTNQYLVEFSFGECREEWFYLD